jgi:hypothetical protein
MQWQRQMYYALYVRGEDAHHRGGGNDFAGRGLGLLHGLNIAALVFLRKRVDPTSVLTRAALLAGVVLLCGFCAHLFMLNGRKLRAEFETERAFVWGAASLAPFAFYVLLTTALAVVALVCASIGARSAG